MEATTNLTEEGFDAFRKWVRRIYDGDLMDVVVAGRALSSEWGRAPSVNDAIWRVLSSDGLVLDFQPQNYISHAWIIAKSRCELLLLEGNHESLFESASIETFLQAQDHFLLYDEKALKIILRSRANQEATENFIDTPFVGSLFERHFMAAVNELKLDWVQSLARFSNAVAQEHENIVALRQSTIVPIRAASEVFGFLRERFQASLCHENYKSFRPRIKAPVVQWKWSFEEYV